MRGARIACRIWYFSPHQGPASGACMLREGGTRNRPAEPACYKMCCGWDQLRKPQCYAVPEVVQNSGHSGLQSFAFASPCFMLVMHLCQSWVHAHGTLQDFARIRGARHLKQPQRQSWHAHGHAGLCHMMPMQNHLAGCAWNGICHRLFPYICLVLALHRYDLLQKVNMPLPFSFQWQSS